MLQIITGKFYKSENRYHNECQAKLYSNVKIENTKQIGHIKLESVESGDDIAEYNVFYDNQLEKIHSEFSMVNVGKEEVVRQLKNIMAFGLNGVVDENKLIIEKMCREKGQNKYPVPRDYLSLILDTNRKLSEKDVESFSAFFEHLIGLKRDDYIKIFNCIVAYNLSINSLNENISLAYSMLVYCLESLAQNYDSYIPVWDDYKEDKKNALEKVFKTMDSEHVEKIKEILIRDEHLKLSKRFCMFIEKNVNEDFFNNQQGRKIVGRDEFSVALSNAYNSRSKYVHTLKPLIKHLTNARISKLNDIFESEHDIYFTYSGLLRVAWDVIYNYTLSLPEVKSELDLDWEAEIPGVFDLEDVSYHRIVGIMDNESGICAKKNLEDFVNCIVYYRDKIPKMDDLIKMYMTHLDSMKTDNKTAAFTLICLYVKMINNIEEETENKFPRLFDKNKKLLEKCSIYSLIIKVMGVDLELHSEWKMEECELIVNEYCKKRFKRKNIKLPKEIEIMIFIEMAIGYEDEDNEDKVKFWMRRAYDNSNNLLKIQEAINNTGEKNLYQLFDQIWRLINQRFDEIQSSNAI